MYIDINKYIFYFPKKINFVKIKFVIKHVMDLSRNISSM